MSCFVNAGVAKFAPLAETSESTYDENFDINIKGAYFRQDPESPAARGNRTHEENAPSQNPKFYYSASRLKRRAGLVPD
jgi:NAD(P)-dependent dehydrogenase (short-subunit alcohol dehydrogenase family)